MKKKILIILIILIGIIAVIFVSGYLKPKEGKKIEYPAPSTYYAMDNVHEVAVRPGGKELYVTSMHVPLIVVIDIDAADYPVLGEIKLPGGDSGIMPDIVFSSDGKYAYVARYHYDSYIASWGLESANYIVVINAVERKTDRLIPIPYKLGGASLAPTLDGRWLYFTTQATPERRSGIGKLDLESGEVVGFLPLSIINFYITLSKDGKYIYVTEGEHPLDFKKPPGFENKPFNLFKVIDAENLKVISSVEVGDGPRYIALTPDGSKAYVSNQWSNDVSVINLKTMEKITDITVGPEPREITFTPDGAKAYVALPAVAQMIAGGPGYLVGNSIAVVDTKQNILLGTVQVHFEPDSVAMDPDGTRLYVSDGGCNGPLDPAEAHVVDTIKDSYLRPIIVRKPSQYAPAGIDVTPDNKKLFVTTFTAPNKGSLLVIDVAAGKIRKKLDINPQAVKVSVDGSKVYVFSPATEQERAKLFIIDSNSLKIIKSINLGKIGMFIPISSYRIVLNKQETVAYVNYMNFDINYAPKGAAWPEWADPDDTGLVAVDLINGKADKIFYSENPAVLFKGIALTPDETRLFISDSTSKTVVVIDTLTNEIITRIPVANSPSELKISKDGKCVYVLQQFNNLMTIIDANTYAVLKGIDFPCCMHAQNDFEFSLDERYIYVASFDSNFVLVYDLQAAEVIKVIDTGLDPLLMASTPDRRYIYVSEVTGDKISVIDTTTNSIVKIVELTSQ